MQVLWDIGERIIECVSHKYVISRWRSKRSQFDNLQRRPERSPSQSPLPPNRT